MKQKRVKIALISLNLNLKFCKSPLRVSLVIIKQNPPLTLSLAHSHNLTSATYTYSSESSLPNGHTPTHQSSYH